MEEKRDIAQICINGHVITSKFIKYPEYRQKYCSECGEKTITNCPNCGENIPGKFYDEIPSFHEMDAPSYCVSCGAPFPWTEKAVSAAKEMAELMESLSDQEKEEYKKEIEYIVTENPRTKVAATKIKHFLNRVGSKTAEEARELLVDIASETAKRIITGK